MDNNTNEILKNERYTINCTLEEGKHLFKLTIRNFVISTIIVSLLFLISSAVLFYYYYETYSTYLFIVTVFFVIIQAYRYADTRKRWKESFSEPDIENVYEFTDEKIICLQYKDGALLNKYSVPYSKITMLSENSGYLTFQFEGKTFCLKKSDIEPSSVLYTHIRDVKQRLKKRNRYIFIGIAIAILTALTSTIANYVANFSQQELMITTYWVNFLFIIIPLISIIYSVILAKKKYPYVINLVIGIIVSGILIVCGCEQFNYMNYFGNSINVVAAAEEKLGIQIPESQNSYFYRNDGYYDDNKEIIYDSWLYYYDEIHSFKDQPVWLYDNPDEFIDMIPNPSNHIWDDCWILYNVDTGEINKVPTESGEHRMVFLSYYSNDTAGVIEIVEYILTL